MNTAHDPAVPVSGAGFHGARVVSFESRMADAMAESIRHHGGAAVSAPSMREVPLETNAAVFAFAEELFAGRVDVLIAMTGVGTRLLLDVLASRYRPEAVVEALGRTTVVARGPKPARVLRERRVPITIVIPEPNTWREILQTLDESPRGLSLQGRTVAVQEYGVSEPRLIEGLRQRGAHVLQVPVYRWAPPEDVQPLRRAMQQIIDGQIDVALFTNGEQVRQVLRCAAEQGLEAPLRQALQRVVIASVGPTTTEALLEHGLAVDFEPTHPKMGPLVAETSAQAAELMRRKRSDAAGTVRPRASSTDTRAQRAQSRFLKACRREPTDATPVWLMRQAGRYMKAYRDVRNTVPFLQLCKTPELVAEVTITAAETLGVDAAIIFSDILLIVEPLGLGLEYTAGEGPVISGEVAGAADIDRLPEIDAASLQYVYDAMRLTRANLKAAIPLIGFAGAPFTLAAYILEGGGSRTFLHTKRLMYSDAGAWHALLEKIGRGLVSYLNGQIAAGADAVQLFDSWVGCLGPAAYREFVLPHTQAVIRGLTPGVPVIHFGTGTGTFLPALREAGGDVIGVDAGIELDEAWRLLGDGVGIQGNLDPAVLCAPRDVMRRHVQRILAHAGGRPGHIFNLGHGVLPQTPVEGAIACVEYVHEISRRRASSSNI